MTQTQTQLANLQRRTPAKPGNTLALKHGARSEAKVRPRSESIRRSVLRELRLSPRDIDPLGRGYLDLYVRALAKVGLIDAYVEEHGLLKGDGETQGAMKLYVALVNSARHSLIRLEAHLAARQHDPRQVLVDYLADPDNGDGG